MSRISPCLWFKDEAEEAANFYISLLPDSRITHVQPNVTDSRGGKIGSVLTVDFILAGQRFLAVNGGMAMEYTHAVSFHIECENQPEIDRLWDALSAGGKIEQCGWLKDRYGVSWQITPAIMQKLLADPDPAVAKRVMDAVLQMVKIDIATLEKARDRELVG